jgi:hypothetical protein
MKKTFMDVVNDLKNFKSLDKKKKTTYIISFIAISIFALFVEYQYNRIRESAVLKADCSIEYSGDRMYAYWFTVGNSYGKNIPSAVNVSNVVNGKGKYSKNSLTISWIKGWIKDNGDMNYGGIPAMNKYMECWEKGYVVGRNNSMD